MSRVEVPEEIRDAVITDIDEVFGRHVDVSSIGLGLGLADMRFLVRYRSPGDIFDVLGNDVFW